MTTNEVCLDCGHVSEHNVRFTDGSYPCCGVPEPGHDPTDEGWWCCCSRGDRTIAALRAENERLTPDATLGANLRTLIAKKHGILIEDNTDFGPDGMHVDTYIYRDCGMIIDREGLGEADTLDAALQQAAEKAEAEL